MEVGMMPPHDEQAEEIVVGKMLLMPDTIDEAIEILPNENVFYLDKHKEIYKAINELHEKGDTVDIVSVKNQLKKNGTLENVGGAITLATLTNKVTGKGGMDTHCRILLEKYFKRETIKSSQVAISESYSDTGDPFQVLEDQYSSLNSLAELLQKKKPKLIKDLVVENIDKIEKAMNSPDRITGIDTGFETLNRYTSGWQNTDLIIIAARPGMGKTSLALCFGWNIKDVVFFSLEMSAGQLVMRLQSMMAEIDMTNMKNGTLNKYQMENIMAESKNIMQTNFHIIDDAGLNIMQMRAILNNYRRKYGFKAVIVDYIQLMSGRGQNREQEISSISRGLKGIAKDFDVPVIALSQLNRSVESRGGDKRPHMSDLRESGAIEQDADIVCFVYRPEYYGIKEDSEGNSTMNYAELIIEKHRNGKTGTVPFKFIGKYTKFIEQTEEEVFK